MFWCVNSVNLHFPRFTTCVKTYRLIWSSMSLFFFGGSSNFLQNMHCSKQGLYIITIITSCVMMCRYVKKHLTLVGRWNMHSGDIKIIRDCQLSDTMNSHKWIQALCVTKRRQELTMLPFFKVKELSNKTVLTGTNNQYFHWFRLPFFVFVLGNSLQEISHPYIPISLVL